MSSWNVRRTLVLGCLIAALVASAWALWFGVVADSAAASTVKVPAGFFPWQFPTANALKTWKDQSFSTKRWWGDFPHHMVVPEHMFKKYTWAIGPFKKYAHNPVLSPTPGEWDCGHLGGGV
ncbi:MAG: hypothetical protein ACP5QA_13480, partial [Phycisphaerae bacterium]